MGKQMQALDLRSRALVITEKPDAASRIAYALDLSGTPKKCVMNGVPYYIAQREREIIVVPALGHLYTVTGQGKGKHGYPVFEVEWVPRYVAERGAIRIKVWLEVISKLAKKADVFIDACDYDLEGSIIGYSILKYACGGKENVANRMKYSTLVRDELEKSYLEMSPKLDFGLIEAGLTRHEVDWLFGINISRALTTAVKKACSRYAMLSTGRVQGPTLRFLAAKEQKIMCFVPAPLWNVKIDVEVGGSCLSITNESAFFQIKSEADKMVNDCSNGKCVVEKKERARFRLMPPCPFDLGSLQREAFRILGFTPMRTSTVAQRLYLAALISYPRTSSQKLPRAIGYEKILNNLGRYREFEKQVAEILSMPCLKPIEGKRDDPAHPAIYPTGNLPEKNLDLNARKLWAIVVKRFFAVFGEPAVREKTKISFNVGGNLFFLSGSKTLDKGWVRLYEPFLRLDDKCLPSLEEGQELHIKKVILEHGFTKPSPRYTTGSLLAKMEKDEIGTKATRAGIIQTLYDRKYVVGEKIEVTDLGLEVVEVLERYCSPITSLSLTHELEHAMDEIQKGRLTKTKVLSAAIKNLTLATTRLKEAELTIGQRLGHAVTKRSWEEKAVGICPTCKTGQLVILHSKSTGKRFVGCTNYFRGSCKTSFPLPQKGSAKPLRRGCSACGWPVVGILAKGKRVWRLCLNPECPSKEKERDG